MVNNLLDFSDKSILVTGAGSGIGRATAVFLSSLNAKLLLIDYNSITLQETLELCNENSATLELDLSETLSIGKLLQEKLKDFGALDGMVHIAGIPYVSPLKSLNVGKVEDVIRINTIAALELAKFFTKNKNNKGASPSIVLISSVYGLVGSAANVAYAVSKSALHGMTRSLAIELAPRKVRVNCVAPGFIKTNMLGEVSDMFDSEYYNRLDKLHPLGLGEAEDIAHSIAFLLSDMSKWITGTVLSVDGGFTAQ